MTKMPTPANAGSNEKADATTKANIGEVIRGRVDPNEISALALQAAASGFALDAPPKLADDILVGAAASAEYLFGSAEKRRRIYHLVHSDRTFPWFRMGGRICCLKSKLREWILRQINPP